MTDGAGMTDPESEPDNAMLADVLRSALHAVPRADVEPAQRAAEITVALQRAWPHGVPPPPEPGPHESGPHESGPHESGPHESGWYQAAHHAAGHSDDGPAFGHHGGIVDDQPGGDQHGPAGGPHGGH